MAEQRFGESGQPVRYAEITEQLGISSRRRIQEIVSELERAHLATFEHLPERGRPLVIVSVQASGLNPPTTDKTGQKGWQDHDGDDSRTI